MSAGCSDGSKSVYGGLKRGRIVCICVERLAMNDGGKEMLAWYGIVRGLLAAVQSPRMMCAKAEAK